jgi:HSP20 family protein
MKLFKHEHKTPEPVPEAVEPEPQGAAPEPAPATPEPIPAPPAFGRMTEHEDDDDLVITVEMPGLDPERDVELTVSHGLLHIEAQHCDEDTTDEDGYVRRELRYARIIRTLPLPAGVSQADIEAGFENGILTVRVPTDTAVQPAATAAAKVPITTT